MRKYPKGHLRNVTPPARNEPLGDCGHGHCWCLCCGVPYCRAEFHTTDYSESGGCFPLCVACWTALHPVERLGYYMSLCDGWECSEEKREMIRAAVLEGK